MKRIFLYLCMVLNVFVASAQTRINTRNQQCLNGWWDFQPVLTEEGKSYSEPKNPAATRLDQRGNPGARIVEKNLSEAKLPR